MKMFIFVNGLSGEYDEMADVCKNRNKSRIHIIK